MIKNDYRRAFIMLRPSLPGFSGHVRLEKRTLTGNMYFVVSAPEGSGALEAALVGRGGDYYAARAGALRRDRRGQDTLAWTFDPRSIEGRPLEAYQWVAIARRDGARCEIALIGNVEGSHALDPNALRTAVCGLFAPLEAAPAFDIPDAQDPEDTPEAAPSPEPLPTAEAPAAQTVEATQEASPVPEAQVVEAAQEAGPVTEPQAIEAVPEAGPEPPAVFEARPAPEAAAPEEVVSAADLLNLDAGQPWSAALEALRPLFQRQSAEDPGLNDGFVYVSAPMPPESGYDRCYIGLHVENGIVNAVRYALPARSAATPPAGLEDYLWMPSGSGGCWVLTASPDTGAPLETVQFRAGGA